MTQDDQCDIPERRREPRIILHKYYSAEISVNGLPVHYQYKIRDVSGGGFSILVNENSELLNHIKVGDSVKVACHLETPAGTYEFNNAEIVYIEKDILKQFKSHYLVGLSAVPGLVSN